MKFQLPVCYTITITIAKGGKCYAKRGSHEYTNIIIVIHWHTIKRYRVGKRGGFLKVCC